MLLFWNKAVQADYLKTEATLKEARTALADGDMDKALSLANTAYGLCEAQRDARLGSAALLLAEVLHTIGQFELAAEKYVVAASSLSDKLVAGGALRQAAEIRLELGDANAALALLVQAREAYHASGDAEALLTTVCRMAFVHYEREQWAAAEKWYREALKLAERRGNIELQDTILLELGNAVAQQERMIEAQALFERGAKLARTTGDKNALSAALHGLAVTSVALGDASRAHTLFRETLRLKRELGDTLGVAHTLYELGVMQAMLGQCDQAMTFLGRSVAMYEQESAAEVEVARAAWNSYALAC
jgi:tetratricopeptide (TPR) repeat protein